MMSSHPPVSSAARLHLSKCTVHVPCTIAVGSLCMRQTTVQTAHSAYAVLCYTAHQQMMMFCSFVHIPSTFELSGYMQRAVEYNVNDCLNAGLKQAAAGYPLAAITRRPSLQAASICAYTLGSNRVCSFCHCLCFFRHFQVNVCLA